MSDDGWTWELSSTAEDDLDGLSPADQDRILDKLDEVRPTEHSLGFGAAPRHRDVLDVEAGGYRSRCK